MAADTRQGEAADAGDQHRRSRARFPGTEVLAVELDEPERFTVFVDHVQGVDHALCERVTYVLRDYLGDYSVDVSSPGLERPLRKPAHFRDAVGRRVALRTTESASASAARSSRPASAPSPSRPNGESVDIPYEAIVRGNLIEEAGKR